MSDAIRILLLADSHLGFDLPARPRVQRRRRGHDFLANYGRALEPAANGEVDAVVHAGDVFHRPQVSTGLAYQAYQPLLRIASRGIPVFIVPGNHERSRLPHASLLAHPRIHIFHEPRTATVTAGGVRLALTGVPFVRRDVRTRFPSLLEQSGWTAESAAVRLLCVHQCVEGATVGPSDFVFRGAADVIRIRDIPQGFAAMLSGHIHRHQVLQTDLHGRVVPTPVLYPGSIERTAAAEAGEPKGFMVLHARADGSMRWEFRRLPDRPLLQREVKGDGCSGRQLQAAVRALIASVPADAVLVVRITGQVDLEALRAVSGPHLRALTPDTMNVEIRADALQRLRRPPTTRRSNAPERPPAPAVSQPPDPRPPSEQTSLLLDC